MIGLHASLCRPTANSLYCVLAATNKLHHLSGHCPASWGVGGRVDCESALRSAGILLSRFEPRHRRPGLMEALKA
ncbi:hypothetical protein PoB_006160100 [Plakobranchus ocellatus]|uniref:Uncharacterized protein n=1 Tax=Plakobranchus ocellatus TaxID=259542 RepID=A0AAV4CT77_9GAST|nr:hypothetical protein PoB_006160100 [Plakobranchus ocellatus]